MKVFRQKALRIAASDVVSLLHEVYPQGVHAREDAEALIALDREFPEPAPEWRSFFSQALADHVLRCSTPTGVLTAEKTGWLTALLAPGGEAITPGGVDLVRLLAERTKLMPTCFSAFSIRTLWRSDAALASPAFATALSARDVSRLQKILKAAGASDAPISIEEAEALFDLHDAVSGKKNHAGFDTLFFRAIVNYLHAASGEKHSRLRALAREPRRDAGEGISREASAWLYARIMRDGRPTVSERLLLALLHGVRPGASSRLRAA